MGVVVLALMTMAAAIPASADLRSSRLEVVSVRDDGAPTGTPGAPAMSADGRFVAFWTSMNLDPRDVLSASSDVYVRDRVAGRTIWASSGPGWSSLRHNSIGDPAISGDGRHVAYFTAASATADDADALSDVFVRDLETSTTELVSVSQAEANYGDPDISSDGRYVAFSGGELLAPAQVFVRDRETGTTEVVSVGTDGQPLPGASFDPSISGDGRYLAFSNLVAEGAPWDIFVRDRVEGTTERLAGVAGGAPVPFSTWEWPGTPSISDDGRHVAFLSAATDLVPRDTNLAPDAFVHDRAMGTTERVSVSSTGGEAAGTTGPGPTSGCAGINPHVPPSSSFFLSISGDGRYASFVSLSDNLVPGDTNECYDVFVHDRLTRTTERVSVTDTGKQAPRAGFYTPAIAPAGDEVAFTHFSKLVPEDTNIVPDVYVRTRGPAIGVGDLEATVSEGTVAASGWATHSGGVISEANDPEGDAGPAGNLAGEDLTAGSLVYRHEREDLLVRLSLAGLLPAGATPVTYGMRFAVASTAYEVRIDEAGATLHRCTPGCTQTATLQGSIGTTGNEALIAIPRAAVEATAGAALTGVRAFTRLGLGGEEIDEVELPDDAIPGPRVELGIAPVGTPEEEVVFDTEGDLVEGEFSGTVNASSLPAGEYRLWARACLGESCGAASVDVSL